MAAIKTSSYNGETLANGLRHGHGTYTYENKFFVYEGQWDQGVKEGQGSLAMGNGVTISGDFVGGEITGIGLKKWPNGSTYSGKFLFGEMHGEGMFLGHNGERYEGDFESNKRHGNGELTKSNGDHFSGTFVNNKIQGYGVMVCSNGDRYEGQWSNGVRDGQGTASWGNGDCYVGGWKQDRRHGAGHFVDGVSGLQHSGDWSEDIPCVRPSHMCLLTVATQANTDSRAMESEEKTKEEEEQGEEKENGSSDKPKDANKNVPVSSLPGTEYCSKITLKKSQVLPELRVAVVHMKMQAIVSEEDNVSSKTLKSKGKAANKKQSKRPLTAESDGPQTEEVEMLLTQESGRKFRLCIVKDTGEPVPNDPTCDIDDKLAPALMLQFVTDGNGKSEGDALTLDANDAEGENETKPIIRSVFTSGTVNGLVDFDAFVLDIEVAVPGSFSLVLDDVTVGIEGEERLPRLITSLVIAK